MTRETAAFLLQLLGNLQLSTGDPNFDKLVAAAQKARNELIEILEVNPEDATKE